MFRKGLLGTAAVALIGAAGLMATPKDASATAFAYAAIEITDFQMNGLTSGFSTFKFIEQGMNVNLNGNVDNTNASAPVTTAGASLDDAQLCVGNCGGFVNNEYVGVGQPVSPVPGPAGQGSFAVADYNMLDTVIDANNAAINDPNNPRNGGTWGTQSGAQSSGNGFGNSSVSSNQQLQWNFTLDADSVIDFTWVEDVHMEVATTNPGEGATAALTFSIQIADANGTVFSDTIFGTDDTLTISDINPPGSQTSGAKPGESGPIQLFEDTQYSLTIFIDSSANAQSIDVPEPGTLGLFGIGLLGLGVAGYRRRKAS